MPELDPPPDPPPDEYEPELSPEDPELLPLEELLDPPEKPEPPMLPPVSCACAARQAMKTPSIQCTTILRDTMRKRSTAVFRRGWNLQRRASAALDGPAKPFIPE